jgi:hypothetical protein
MVIKGHLRRIMLGTNRTVITSLFFFSFLSSHEYIHCTFTCGTLNHKFDISFYITTHEVSIFLNL